MHKITIFISYSHEDTDLFREFKKGIENYSKNSTKISWDIWSDIEIHPGKFWHETIQDSVKKSQAAILLVSQHFFVSNYIKNEEFLRFVKKNTDENFTFFPVLLSDCDYRQWEELTRIQFFNPQGQDYELKQFRNKIAPYDYIKEQNLKNTYFKKCVEAFEQSVLSNHPDTTPTSDDAYIHKNTNRQQHPSRPTLITLNPDEKLTLEIATRYIDTGDYVTAKNLFLGGMKFEDIPFEKQMIVLIIEQKHGLLADAQIHLKYLYDNDLTIISNEQIALLGLLRLKILSQAHRHKEVVDLFPEVEQLLIDTEQEIRVISALNRAGIAYAILGNLSQSQEYLQKGLYLSKKYQEPHMEITSQMYGSIAKFFRNVKCDIDNPYEQIVECQSSYFENPISETNINLWQAYNFKSIVQCLFAEAAILRAKGKEEQSYIRLTAANLLVSVVRSSPCVEGYAELIATISQDGIQKLVKTAMHQDEKHKDEFQRDITSISSYLKQLQIVVPPLYHSPSLSKWKKLRAFFAEFDKRNF